MSVSLRFCQSNGQRASFTEKYMQTVRLKIDWNAFHICLVVWLRRETERERVHLHQNQITPVICVCYCFLSIPCLPFKLKPVIFVTGPDMTVIRPNIFHIQTFVRIGRATALFCQMVSWVTILSDYRKMQSIPKCERRNGSNASPLDVRNDKRRGNVVCL